MRKFSSRGLSEIVATILLVLLAIAAVALAAQFLIPFVRTSLTESSACVNYQTYFSFYDAKEDPRYNCYGVEQTTPFRGLYAVSIAAQTHSIDISDKVQGFALVFSEDGSSHRVDVVNGSVTLGTNEGVRMLRTSEPTLLIPRGGEVETYIFNTTHRYQHVSIHPILTNNRLCDATDTISLGSVCGSGVPISIP